MPPAPVPKEERGGKVLLVGILVLLVLVGTLFVAASVLGRSTTATERFSVIGSSIGDEPIATDDPATRSEPGPDGRMRATSDLAIPLASGRTAILAVPPGLRPVDPPPPATGAQVSSWTTDVSSGPRRFAVALITLDQAPADDVQAVARALAAIGATTRTTAGSGRELRFVDVASTRRTAGAAWVFGNQVIAFVVAPSPDDPDAATSPDDPLIDEMVALAQLPD